MTNDTLKCHRSGVPPDDAIQIVIITITISRKPVTKDQHLHFSHCLYKGYWLIISCCFYKLKIMCFVIINNLVFVLLWPKAFHYLAEERGIMRVKGGSGIYISG